MLGYQPPRNRPPGPGTPHRTRSPLDQAPPRSRLPKEQTPLWTRHLTWRPVARHARIPPAMHAWIAQPPLRPAARSQCIKGKHTMFARHAGIPPPTCGQTHTCKNITFATSLRTVISFKNGSVVLIYNYFATYVSLRLRVQNAVPAQPCVGKLGISLVLLNFLHCNFRLWFKTP